MTTRERDEGATLTAESVESTGEGESAHLLVLEGDSSSIFPLPAAGAVLLGRGTEADLKLRDQSASRRHARIVVADGRATVSDLDSHNGTRVNSERIEGARSLASGDVIGIGDVTLVFHRRTRPRGAGRLADLEQLRRRLAEEVERALSYGRPLHVLSASLGAVHEEPEKLARAADEALRLIDVASIGDGAHLVVLMPEAGADEARERAERLLGALTPLAPAAKAGLAACPADGGDADALLEAARAAATAAATGTVASAGTTVAELPLAERRILVADQAMLRIFDLLRRLAASDLPVLICGETGAGKENAAFAVHHWSARRDKPFVTLNCAALQETLVESELFGYEKGAFSGAVGQKPGLLETAHGGTAFLDEVGELSASAQAKLLRALEAKRVTRLGSVKEREIDIRVVAATNRKLEEDVQAGRFRQDLFFRLSAATVLLPPLRERPREIALLARSFLDAACARSGKPAKRLASTTVHALARYGWPGNVRELKNAMEYVAATAFEDAVEPRHLPDRIRGGVLPASPPPQVPQASAASPAARTFRPIADEIRGLEETRMLEALQAADGVRKRAAELIGMPLRTFVLKFGQYDLATRLRDKK
jgi:DNA-binding NtrC family response regulator/pSer/pThr/pTyr-binding forkhead associated (FHA) protein